MHRRKRCLCRERAAIGVQELGTRRVRVVVVAVGNVLCLDAPYRKGHEQPLGVQERAMVGFLRESRGSGSLADGTGQKLRVTLIFRVKHEQDRPPRIDREVSNSRIVPPLPLALRSRLNAHVQIGLGVTGGSVTIVPPLPTRRSMALLEMIMTMMIAIVMVRRRVLPRRASPPVSAGPVAVAVQAVASVGS